MTQDFEMAVERLRKDPPTYGSYHSGHRGSIQEKDVALVVAAYLREHPADDDEPFDPEQAGWDQHQGGHAQYWFDPSWPSTIVFCTTTNALSFRGSDVLTNPTRRQVRLLREVFERSGG